MKSSRLTVDEWKLYFCIDKFCIKSTFIGSDPFKWPRFYSSANSRSYTVWCVQVSLVFWTHSILTHIRVIELREMFDAFLRHMYWLDVYHISFHTWCGLSANLECMPEICCTWLAGNAGPKKIAKNVPSGHHRTTLSAYIFATKACIDNRKKTC